MKSITYLGWELNFFIRPPRPPMNRNQWERLSWKTAYAMILAHNTKWVSTQLFVCVKKAFKPLGRGCLLHLCMTGLLLFWPVDHIDPLITDWVTKPSHMPWAGNLPICQIVTHFNFLVTWSPYTIKIIIVLHETWYVQRYQKGLMAGKK